MNVSKRGVTVSKGGVTVSAPNNYDWSTEGDTISPRRQDFSFRSRIMPHRGGLPRRIV